jgi:hypothetical protein
MDVLGGVAVLMVMLGPLVIRRFWKVRPTGATTLSIVNFWLMPSASVIGTWLLAAGYLIGEHVPESSGKRVAVLTVGGLILIDFLVLFVVAPLVSFAAGRAAHSTKREDGAR